MASRESARRAPFPVVRRARVALSGLDTVTQRDDARNRSTGHRPMLVSMHFEEPGEPLPMTLDSAAIDERITRIPVALRWLRLLAGVVSLREADRRFREVRGGADMQFGSLLSKWERGITTQRLDVLGAYLAILGFDFADLETAIFVATCRSRKDPVRALRQRLKKGDRFADGFIETVRKAREGSEAELINQAVAVAREAFQ